MSVDEESVLLSMLADYVERVDAEESAEELRDRLMEDGDSLRDITRKYINKDTNGHRNQSN